MGRIGKRKIEIPQGVELKVDSNKLIVKGPKGSLTQSYLPQVEIKVEETFVQTICKSSDYKTQALQGLYNSLIVGMIEGVTKGFEKRLDMVGVGYRAAKQGRDLNLSIGYSHPVIIVAPQGIDLSVEGQNKIIVKGIDKQLVGEVAAKIKRVRKVEPYKGKGIRYEGEKVRKKAGKAAKAAAGA